MFLRDIEVITDESIGPIGLTVAWDVKFLEDLYVRKLKKASTTVYSKINIYLSAKKEFEVGGLQRDVLDCYMPFDFSYYNGITESYSQKKFLLDIKRTSQMC